MLEAQRPRIVDFQGELTLHLPPHYQSLEEGEEKQEIRSRVEKSILLFTYESKAHRENPALGSIFKLPHLKIIRETISFAANTWDRGIIPLRECLLRIRR
jgi:hypothetical protein